MLEVERRSDESWTFFTFTLLGIHHKSSAYSLHYWRKSWDKLMKRLKRQYGKFAYVRIFETHKSGAFHVHMLASCRPNDLVEVTREDGKIVYESAAVLKHLNDLKLGYIHDCKPLDGDETREDNSVPALVASYLAKYLTKDIQSDVRTALKQAEMGRIRMIQPSQGFSDVPKAKKRMTWTAEPIRKLEFEDLQAIGVKTIDVDRRITLALSDFGEFSHYPNPDVDILAKWEDQF